MADGLGESQKFIRHQHGSLCSIEVAKFALTSSDLANDSLPQMFPKNCMEGGQGVLAELEGEKVLQK